MLDVLTQLEDELPGLIDRGTANAIWGGYKLIFKKNTITFRAETHWRDCLVRLNHFLPVTGGDEVLHPHVWPGAIHVLSGGYEMDLAFGEPEGWGKSAPKPNAQFFIGPGSRYSMLDHRVWHAIRPKVETFSVCLCGPNFEEIVQAPLEPGTVYERERLNPEQVTEHLAHYKRYF